MRKILNRILEKLNDIEKRIAGLEEIARNQQKVNVSYNTNGSTIGSYKNDRYEKNATY